MMTDVEIERLLADPNFRVDDNMGFYFGDVDCWVEDAQKALRELRERAKQAEERIQAVLRLADDMEREAPKPGVGGWIADEIRLHATP